MSAIIKFVKETYSKPVRCRCSYVPSVQLRHLHFLERPLKLTALVIFTFWSLHSQTLLEAIKAGGWKVLIDGNLA